MEIAVLILIHISYLLGMLNGLFSQRGTGVLRGVILTILCWNENTTWGIATLCFTSIVSLITLLIIKTDK